ncbi:MAG TPA: cytochrome c [Vicinamibacterales bacterium]|nr:cytochrome c [Vicinamibacterales bacterium]
MFRTHASCALLLIFALAVATRAQQPARGRGAGPGTGQIGGAVGAYPARPPADPAALERGKAAYGTYCTFCHGADTRGGDGGPSLLRSGVVLDDQNGELIGPVVVNGRPDRGMPKFALTPAQIGDIATFLHSFRVNGYDDSRNRPPSIVVGSANEGEAYFKSRCASCHSATGDLQGVATRFNNPRTLQQSWLMPGSAGGRGVPTPTNAKPPRATVTTSNGEKIEGELERVDDFSVAIRLEDGTRRAWRIVNGIPRVTVTDPLQAHRELLKEYKDDDIHNVTAYLVTLK